MTRVCGALMLVGVVVSTVNAAAQQSGGAQKELWLVVAKQQPGITLYDARTDEVICKAKTGISPHEAAFSLDGRVAYVPVYGNANVGQPGTDEHALHFISTSDCRELAVMDTGEHTRPHAIAVGRSGLAYVTSENKQSIAIIDPKTRTVVGSVPTGSPFTHFLAVTADEKQAFTSNVGSKTISVLDLSSRTMAKSLETGTNNQRMAISPNQRWFASQLGQERKVNVYRVTDAGLDFSVPVDGSPFVGRFSADNKYLLRDGVGWGRRHRSSRRRRRHGAAPRPAAAVRGPSRTASLENRHRQPLRCRNLDRRPRVGDWRTRDQSRQWSHLCQCAHEQPGQRARSRQLEAGQTARDRADTGRHLLRYGSLSGAPRRVGPSASQVVREDREARSGRCHALAASHPIARGEIVVQRDCMVVIDVARGKEHGGSVTAQPVGKRPDFIGLGVQFADEAPLELVPA